METKNSNTRRLLETQVKPLPDGTTYSIVTSFRDAPSPYSEYDFHYDTFVFVETPGKLAACVDDVSYSSLEDGIRAHGLFVDKYLRIALKER